MEFLSYLIWGLVNLDSSPLINDVPPSPPRWGGCRGPPAASGGGGGRAGAGPRGLPTERCSGLPPPRCAPSPGAALAPPGVGLGGGRPCSPRPAEACECPPALIPFIPVKWGGGSRRPPSSAPRPPSGCRGCPCRDRGGGSGGCGPGPPGTPRDPTAGVWGRAEPCGCHGVKFGGEPCGTA